MFLDFDSLVREIKSKRKNHEWTQKQLAKKAGVSQSLVAKIERKENIPNYKSVRRIYNVLEKNTDRETAGEIANPDITDTTPNNKIREVAQTMLKKDYSQIPVKENDEYIGMILSKDIVDENGEKPVKEVMRNSFPIIPSNTPKKAVIELLKDEYNAILIKYENERWGIITPADLL